MSLVLIDGNNFYICCERVLSPRLEVPPVFVLSKNDRCVGACSGGGVRLWYYGFSPATPTPSP